MSPTPDETDVDISDGLAFQKKQATPRQQYIVAGLVDIGRYSHATYGAPIYTSFTHPLHSYASVLVQRQLHAALKGERLPPCLNPNTVVKTVRHCNVKEEAGARAYEQSTALYTVAHVHRTCLSTGEPIIKAAVVTAIHNNHTVSVYIPDYHVQRDINPAEGTVNTIYHPQEHTLDLVWTTESEAGRRSSVSVMLQDDDEYDRDLMFTIDDVAEGPSSTHETPEHREIVQTIGMFSKVTVLIQADMKVLRPALEVALANPLLIPDVATNQK